MEGFATGGSKGEPGAGKDTKVIHLELSDAGTLTFEKVVWGAEGMKCDTLKL